MQFQQHSVSVPSFAIGKYAVTFAEWDACVSDGGCNGVDPPDHGWGRGSQPVIDVSWLDAQSYISWLNAKVRASGGNGAYRLPTENEWEYAARAGAMTAYWWGDYIGTGNANCYNCGSAWDRKHTAPVGSFRPNSFGLYDMLGNVWQWTDDCFGTVSNGNCERIKRGGAWDMYPDYLIAAYRSKSPPDLRTFSLGFRLAKTLP